MITNQISTRKMIDSKNIGNLMINPQEIIKKITIVIGKKKVRSKKISKNSKQKAQNK